MPCPLHSFKYSAKFSAGPVRPIFELCFRTLFFFLCSSLFSLIFRLWVRAILFEDPFRRGWLSWQPAHELIGCLSWEPVLAKIQTPQLKSCKIPGVRRPGSAAFLLERKRDFFPNKKLFKRTSTKEPWIQCFLPFEKGTSASLIGQQQRSVN